MNQTEAGRMAINELSEEEAKFLCWYVCLTLNSVVDVVQKELREILGAEERQFGVSRFMVPAPRGVTEDDVRLGTSLSRLVADRTVQIETESN